MLMYLQIYSIWKVLLLVFIYIYIYIYLYIPLGICCLPHNVSVFSLPPVKVNPPWLSAVLPRSCEAAVFMRPPFTFTGKGVDLLIYLSHLHDSPVWIMTFSRFEAFTCKNTVSSTNKCAGSSNLRAAHRTANGTVSDRFISFIIWLRD